jgi:hypothetical protein
LLPSLGDIYHSLKSAVSVFAVPWTLLLSWLLSEESADMYWHLFFA